MEMPEYFTPLPLSIDTSGKTVSSTSSIPGLAAALERLNAMHRSLQQLDPPSLLAPPPPQPPFINPKRSQQIAKLRESGQAALKKQSSQNVLEPQGATAPQSEVIKLYTLALDMALQRPVWEPQQLLREELAAIYTSRAAAYASLRGWPDALTDCRLSLEAKQQGNPGAWRIGCDALRQMGRIAEARDLVKRGVVQEEATLQLLRSQVAQIPNQHPNQHNAKQSLQSFERELDALRDMGRALGAM